MRNSLAKHRANQRAAKERKRLARGESELSQELRWLAVQRQSQTEAFDTAEVVAFDGRERTITLRFDWMPCAAIGEQWLVRPVAHVRA